MSLFARKKSANRSGSAREQVVLDSLNACYQIFSGQISAQADSAAEPEAPAPGGGADDIRLRLELAIIEVVAAAFPEDRLLIAESSDLAPVSPGNNWSGWVADPLSGASNFARHIPFYATSITYIENGQPLLSGIIDPVHNQLFTAKQASGAWLNNVRIHPERLAGLLGERLILPANMLKDERIRQLRIPWADQLGSVALSYAYLACGRADAVVQNNLWPGESAAGQLLAQEAGMLIVDYAGAAADWQSSQVVAGAAGLVEEIVVGLARKQTPTNPAEAELRRQG